MASKVSELLQNQVNQLTGTIATLPAGSQTPLNQVLADLRSLAEQVSQQELFLETAAAISSAADNATYIDDLLNEAAFLIKDRFEFDLVHIFLLSRSNRWADLHATTDSDTPAEKKLKITDDSLVGAAINHQQPRLAVTKNAGQAAFPLTNRGRAIGAILVKHASPAMFSEQNVQLFQSNVANQLANAAQNATLLTNADQQLDQLITLHSINLQIGMASNPDKLLTDVAELSAKLVAADACLIRFVDSAGESLRVKAAYHPPHDVALNTVEPVAAGLGGRVIATQEAVLAPDWPQHPLAATCKLNPSIKALLMVPLRIQETVIGVIEVYHYSNLLAFNENTLYTLSLLAAQAGAAIERTRLFTEAENNRRFLKTIIEHIPDPIFIKNRNHIWIEMNQANAKVIGRPEQELIGKTDNMLFAPEVANEYYRRDIEVFNSNQILECEDTTTWGDNIDHVAYTRLIPMPGETGQPEYILGLSHDVTERKAHEAEREQFLAEMSALYTGTREISNALNERQIFNALIEQIRGYDPCEVVAYRLKTVHGQPVWAEVQANWHKKNTPTFPAGAALFLPQTPLRRLFTAGEAVFIEALATDAGLSPEERTCLADTQAQSIALLPLNFIEQKLGVVMVCFTTPAVFTKAIQRFWLSMVDQAGMALSNHQLIQEAAFRVSQMETAAAIAQAASAMLDLDELLNSVVALIRDRFNLYYVGAFLVDAYAPDWAQLKAGAGAAASTLLAQDYRVKIDDDTRIGRAIYRQQAQLALNVGPEAEVIQNPHLPETRSEITLPLLYHAQAIGALTLQSRDEAAFSRQDIIFLQNMADQLTNAIENARLYQQAQQELADKRRAEEGLLVALERTESLYRIGSAMAGLTSEQALYETVLLQYLRMLNLQPAYGSAFKLEHARDFTKVQLLVVNGQAVTSNLSFAAGQDLVGKYLIERKTPLVIDNVLTHPLTKISPKFWQQDAAVRAMLFIPMIMHDNVVGAIAAGSVEAGHNFGQNDIEIGQVITDQLAVWLENRQLLASTQYRTERLQTAAEVSRAASSILNVDELSNTSVNLIRDSFNFYYVGLFMLDETKEWAVLKAGTGKAGRIQLIRNHRLKTGGESMIGWCIANRKARIALDVGEEAVRFKNPILPDTHSEMALPLINRNEVVGAITVQSTERAAFSDEDITMLQTMADQIANALVNAQLFERVRQARREAEQRLRETEALQKVGEKLVGTLNDKEILDIFLKACTTDIGFEYAVLALVDKPANVVRAVGGVGVSESHIKASARTLDSTDIMADIVRTGRTEIITGWDSRFDQELYESEGHDNWVRLFTPVQLRHETVGLVEAGFNRGTKASITEAQIRLVNALISQTILAIDNANRYEQSQLATRREALIKEITAKVRSSANLDTILQTTVKEIGNAIANKRAYIHLAAATQANGQAKKEGLANE